MQTVKNNYFELKDLGNKLTIKDVEFGRSNNFGLYATVILTLKDKKLEKELELPTNELRLNMDLDTFDDGGNNCIYFSFLEGREAYNENADEYRETMFDIIKDNEMYCIFNIFAKDDLLRVLEAYVTVIFNQKIGVPFESFWLTNSDILNEMDYKTNEPDFDYMKELKVTFIKSIIIRNYELFMSGKKITGKDIDYPRFPSLN